MRFAGLSGMGWLLDFAILLTLVGRWHVPPWAANLVSSCVAALSVFLTSRYLVFQRAPAALGVRVALYLGYTLLVIMVAATVLQGLIGPLAASARSLGLEPTATGLAAAAKVLVTPPQLLLNFFVARAMAERRIAPRRAA